MTPSSSLKEKTLARLLRARAQTHGDKPFLLFQGQCSTYAQTYEAARRIAGGLQAAGVKQKQHVAILMENRSEVVLLNFALALLGAVSVPINAAARADMLAYFLRQSDSVAIVTDSTLADRVTPILEQCPLLRLMIVAPEESTTAPSGLDTGDVRLEAWQKMVASEPLSAEFEGPAFDDTLQILYSSGTTGVPKGTMIANATAILAAEKHVECFGYAADDVMHTCLPLFHANALNCTVLPALMAGATVALSRRFSTSGFWREINDSGATRTSMLSAMINFLWLKEPSPEERTHKLKTCVLVPTPEFSVEFEKRFNVRLTSLYAIGDFGYVSMLRPEDSREKIRSAGQILPEVDIDILDDEDLPVAPGEVGQICLRAKEPWFGRQGYYKLPELWVNVTRNLWLHTGDRGWLDEDGYLYFAGRSKDLIRRRGENISAIQVEEVLRAHPGVADAAVYAMRAEFLEDEVMASLTLRSGNDVEYAELIEFCAARMAYFMVPRFVEILPELPLTETGKVEKYKLREAAEKRLSAIWDREKSGIVLQR